jgi:hypothetical protein
VEGAAAMAGGAEGYALGGDGWVGMERVVGGDEAGDVGEICGQRMVAGLVGRGDGLCVGRAHAFGVLGCECCHHCTIWDVRLIDRMTRK